MPNEKPQPDEPVEIKSVKTSNRIIDTLVENGGMGVTEIAEELDVSKSTVHHHLSTLRQLGFVIKQETTYRVGLKFLTIGDHARRSKPIFEYGTRSLSELRKFTSENEVVQLAAEENGIVTYLRQADARHAERMPVHPGTTVDLHSAAAGKAILAWLPESRTDAILAEELPARTENTITDPDQLYRQIEVIRERNIAFDYAEHYHDVCSVATPVITQNDELLGSVVVSVPAEQVDRKRFTDELPNYLRSTAKAIGFDADYQSWSN